jgi:hypothetical protein
LRIICRAIDACGYAIFSDAPGLLYEKGARTAPIIAR